MIDWTLIITGLISALAGGGLASYFNYKINSKKEDNNEFNIILEQYKLLRKSDIDEINLLKTRINELEDRDMKKTLEIQNLKHQLMVFESSHLDIPLPNWIKDTSGKMLFVNKEYEEAFLKPRDYIASDYVGNDDYSVWEDKIAKAIIKTDRKVIRDKKPVKTIEQIPDLDGSILYIEVLKYPRKFKNIVIGIGGIVLRQSKEKLTINT